MIVILNGPHGVGKTSIIRRLGERVPWLAHVDQSVLSRCILQSSHAADCFVLARENLLAITANCVQRGYHVFVEGTFELDSELDALCSRLAALDPLVYRFLLRCDRDELAVRAGGGARPLHQAEWFDRAPGDFGLRIDTTDRGVDYVADEILQHIEYGRAAYGARAARRVPPLLRPLARTA